MLKINDVNLDILKQQMKNNSLELISVACFYSQLYTSPDNFIEECESHFLQNYTFLLKNNPEENIVQSFIDTNIEKSENQTISWNNIHYIWKQFLDKNNYPSLMFSSQLKEILKIKLSYNEENDSFQGTSVYLPYINQFLLFWNQHITESNDTLLISELVQIYKHWYLKNNLPFSTKEKNILKILSHFFPTIHIDKHTIQNVECNLWNKSQEIEKIFDLYKLHFQEKVQNHEIELPFFVSLFDIYQFYLSHLEQLNKTIDLIINKKYFIEYLSSKYHQDLQYNKFLPGNFFI